tara:strand:- start:232 stop:1725 length:1494 start_codon:yes stop_codon:yes gene_type:complete
MGLAGTVLEPTKELDLDIMIQSVEKKIIERIKDLQKLNRDGKIKTSTFNNEMKKARRSLGTIVTNNPNVLEKDLVKLFGKGDLSPERVTKHFRNYTDNITKLYQSVGKEGHHSQGIGTLRDYLVDMDFDIRKQYKNIAKLRGFKIGDQYMKYLDTGAHRSMTRGIEGILKKRGYKLEDLPPGLIQALEARMAHAKQFGGQSAKIKIPQIELRGIVKGINKAGDAEKLVDISSGLLSLNKAGTQSGIMLDQIFNNPALVDDLDALYAAVQKTPIIKTNVIQQGMSEIEKNIRQYGPNIPDHVLKGHVHNILKESAKITKQIDQAIDVIPGSRFIKKNSLSFYGLTQDALSVLASPSKLDKEGTESEIGTTNYMRNRYKRSAETFRKLGGVTGALSFLGDVKKFTHGRKAPLPWLKKLPGGNLKQQGLLATTSILSYLTADRADHLSKNYKSDVDKVTESLIPSTPGFSGVGQTELKQGKKSVLEDIKTKYNNWIYGIN